MGFDPVSYAMGKLAGGGGGADVKLELLSIAVTTPPTKTAYNDGDTFDPTGMVVEGTYIMYTTSANMVNVIPNTDYTVTPAVLTAGTTEVTISYTDYNVTKTTTQSVTVT